MREVPECLNRRYRALDELVQELSSSLSHRRELDGACSHKTTDDPGIELMCKFWNILKEDPECDLTQAVEDRMRVNTKGSSMIRPPPITCYMASNTSRKGANLSDKVKSGCCTSNPQPSTKDRDSCCGSKSPTPSAAGADALPLSKVLCNLKEAASFDKKCNARVSDLIRTQKELQEQITHLEHREREGTNLLKQADCMWSCMEESYKKKVAESIQRQQDLMKQLKEVEKSATKWRKNKKEVESQVYSIHKCQQEIIDKIHQKTNDIKCMDMEIQGFKKKIESNKKEIANASKLTTNKKQASTAKINGIATQVALLQKSAAEAVKYRYSKEGEGSKYIKEAREDLQQLCRVLLQKKLENEDLRAEKDALLLEIDLLKQTCDQCKDRCKNKQVSINDEIKEVEKSIATFKVKCIRCHECTDTIDIRKFCTDCPKCAEERDCLYEADHCNTDTAMDCVCMSVKQKFLDNVFDNMYTVLEKQARTGPGKAVADQVLGCLKRSRNGKLNDETRRLLQDFILTTVKKNLNLTIVGGAVKTRCEMDPETYQQLMTCLKRVKAQRPPKADKGTNAKKEPCRRWGEASECNCPKGPKACICTKKAPPPPQDPSPCPPKDKEDAGQEVKCPFKGSASCGPDCAMHAVPSLVGTDIAAWRPDPCQGQSCPFSKNMRAAQCVLGPESLVSLPKSNKAPYDPDKGMLDDMDTCKCGKTSSRPCSCRSSHRSRPREKIIEEVFGRYTDVTPIEKVTYLEDRGESQKISDYMSIFYSKSSTHSLVQKSSVVSFYTCSSSGHMYPFQNNDPNENLCKTMQLHNCEKGNIEVSIEYGTKNNNKDGWITKNEENPDNVNSNVNMLLFSSEYEGIAVQFENGVGNHFRESVDSAESIINNISENVEIEIETDKTELLPEIELHNRTLCETVNDLIKEVIVCEPELKDTSYSSSLEWMIVNSFLKEISSVKDTSDKINNSTINEFEVTNELLGQNVILQEYYQGNYGPMDKVKDVKCPFVEKDCTENVSNGVTDTAILTSTDTSRTFDFKRSLINENSYNSFDTLYDVYNSNSSLNNELHSIYSHNSEKLSSNVVNKNKLCLYELTQLSIKENVYKDNTIHRTNNKNSISLKRKAIKSFPVTYDDNGNKENTFFETLSKIGRLQILNHNRINITRGKIQGKEKKHPKTKKRRLKRHISSS